MSALRYVPWEGLVLAVALALVLTLAVAAPLLGRGETAAALVRGARVLLLGAVAAVGTVTLVGGVGGTGVNLLPGAGIATALDNVDRDLAVLNLVGNVAMFVPVGLLAPAALQCRYRAAVGACVALSLALELVQLLVGRSLDVDDVLLNGVGGALGAVPGVLVACWAAHRPRRAATATVPR